MSIYDVLKIEKRRDSTFWVLDKRGPNVVERGPFSSMEGAQAAWSEWAEVCGRVRLGAQPERRRSSKL